MLRRLCYSMILSLSISSIFGQSNLPKNGVIVQFDAQNKPYLQYQVLKGQNLFQIRSKYGLSENELSQMNPSIRMNQINAGQWLNIPIEHLMQYNTTLKESDELIPVYYQAKPKESLFSISRNKTKWNVSTLQMQNHLKLPQIRQDQMLIIAYLSQLMDAKPLKAESSLLPKKEEPIGQPDNSPVEESVPSSDMKPSQPLLSNYKNEVRGVAFCTNSSGSSNYFALYNKVKRGSLIEIYNPVVEKSVLAKVVGKIPANYSSDIQVVVSNSVMESVGALGPKFFVYVRH